MKKGRFFVLLCALFAMVACDDDTPLQVSDDELVGTWKKEYTEEYWSYHADQTGAKWDASEGFSEQRPSYSYTWNIMDGNRLKYTTMGDTINVPITRIYVITEMSENRMVREEELGTYTLYRIN